EFDRRAASEGARSHAAQGDRKSVRSISPLGSLTCGFGERSLSRPGGAAGCRNQGLADSLSSLSCPDTSSARSLARRGLRFQKSPPHWALQDIVNIWFEGPQ